MAKYLFTSDQRISDLENRIKFVAQHVQTHGDVSDITNKSDNNNAATLKFYYNLQKGTETCQIAQINPKFAIRNYVNKFQFPNPRTHESMRDSLEEGTFLAPFRVVISVLYMMAEQNSSKESSLSIEEILYFIFANPLVHKNPSFNYNELITKILETRNQFNNWDSTIPNLIKWNQYPRQANEMMAVLPYASQCFKLRNRVLTFSMNTPTFEQDVDFINEVIKNNYYWFPSNKDNYTKSLQEYISYMDTTNTPYQVYEFKQNKPKPSSSPASLSAFHLSLLAALRTKPFVLLAGISGTGKSRIVRKLAQACWEIGSTERNAQVPENFCMVQVKPNWHDSSELIGYVSRIGGESEYIAGDFLRFVVKAWENPDVPYFLCLDEMNLAPVEQYFAEYLSIVESRRLHPDGKIHTDPIIKKVAEPWYHTLVNSLTDNELLCTQFLTEGIALPLNLLVVGTVNMDETTYTFSRKVLDRAMVIEMNEVNLSGGLSLDADEFSGVTLQYSLIVPQFVEAKDFYAEHQETCDQVIENLNVVNNVLDGTPFKIAYRTRNEILLYVVNRIIDEVPQNQALDEAINMKILSRIEGDKNKVITKNGEPLLPKLFDAVKLVVGDTENSPSLQKLEEMKQKLANQYYCTYWN